MQCHRHSTPNINALKCMYRAPGQDAPCGHRRCNDCTITFDGCIDLMGLVVPLKRTYLVRDYPGAEYLQGELEEAWDETYKDL